MEELLIGYDFKFNLAVKKRNGKTYKSHTVMGLGCTYDNALWDAHHKLKKRKTEILKVNSVTACRIAVAIQDGWSVTVTLAEYPPLIPEDLNSKLKYLPK